MRKIDFGSARKWAEELHGSLLTQGDTAIDATMGNGYDTERLCNLVGDTGRVYAFDVQEAAVESTRQRLEKAGLLDRAELILAGHERCAELAPEGVALAAFNLGWLPGTEHSVTTRVETTLTGANACLTLLRPGGVLTICVYPGHAEGARELAALTEWAEALDPDLYDSISRGYRNQPNDPPVLIAVKRVEKRRKRAL